MEPKLCSLRSLLRASKIVHSTQNRSVPFELSIRKVMKLVVLFVVLAVYETNAFSAGAPSCEIDQPGHGVDPQRSASPFALIVERVTDQSFDVSVSGQGILKGLLVVPDAPGNFVNLPDFLQTKPAADGQGVNCLTHAKPNVKKLPLKVRFECVPGSNCGQQQPQFRVIFVSRKDTFWTP